MTKAEKEDPSAARRVSTSHCEYECALPSEVLDELLSSTGERSRSRPGERRRQRALPPPGKRKPGWRFTRRLLLVVLVASCVFWAGESRRERERVSSVLPVSRSGTLGEVVRTAVSPTPAPLPVAALWARLEGSSSANAPFSLGSGGWRCERPNADALDGEIPAPRATRVFRVGVPVVVRMPDGVLIQATFRGTKSTFYELPTNPQPNDLWRVVEGNNHLWLWSRLEGHAAPSWIDP